MLFTISFGFQIEKNIKIFISLSNNFKMRDSFCVKYEEKYLDMSDTTTASIGKAVRLSVSCKDCLVKIGIYS